MKTPFYAILQYAIAGAFLWHFTLESAVDIRQTDVFKRLNREITVLEIVDTHEHLAEEAQFLGRPADVLATMLHYLQDDLVSSGLDDKQQLRGKGGLQDTDIPIQQRWVLFDKYWKNSQYTSYGRAFRRAILDLYGMDINKMSPEDAAKLNEKIREKRKPGFYKWVLKDKAKILVSIVDGGRTKVDRDFFAPVLRYDRFVRVRSKQAIENFSKEFGREIKNLDDFIQALDTAFERGVKEGIVGIKSGLAYERRIFYPLPPQQKAEAAFVKLISGKELNSEEQQDLENFMMHQVCKMAAKYKLPFQIHTGLHAGNRGNITNSRPTDLIPLIQQHPEVKFVLFHGGYPYGKELGVMAKNFPNVYIDMCWLHIISEKTAREDLKEWLLTVPVNKIMGFGGDYLYPEGAYAHSMIARENVAVALTELVVENFITQEQALEVAKKILRDNALELFKLENIKK